MNTSIILVQSALLPIGATQYGEDMVKNGTNMIFTFTNLLKGLSVKKVWMESFVKETFVAPYESFPVKGAVAVASLLDVSGNDVPANYNGVGTETSVRFSVNDSVGNDLFIDIFKSVPVHIDNVYGISFALVGAAFDAAIPTASCRLFIRIGIEHD